MNRVDLLIIVLTLVFGLIGLRQGLISGVFSLVGFAVGAMLGSRLAPLVLPGGASSPYTPVLALSAAIVLGTFLSGLMGSLGVRITRLGGRLLAGLDELGGAVVFAVVALGLTWVSGAALLQAPVSRDLRHDLRQSAILTQLNLLLPPASEVLHALARLDPLPELSGPSTNVPPPAGAILRDPDVRAARRSVVRVTGSACGVGVAGSGWFVAQRVVVTNAHVVAGQSDTTVQFADSLERFAARPVWFDRRNDIALLSVDTAGRALPVSSTTPPRGRAVAILGFPENGPYDMRAGRIGSTDRVISQDAYGRGPVRRKMTSFRGLVRHGNSGGPLVDGRGVVAGLVFATTQQSRRKGGLAVPVGVVRDAVDRASRSRTVSTGPCS